MSRDWKWESMDHDQFYLWQTNEGTCRYCEMKNIATTTALFTPEQHFKNIHRSETNLDIIRNLHVITQIMHSYKECFRIDGCLFPLRCSYNTWQLMAAHGNPWNGHSFQSVILARGWALLYSVWVQSLATPTRDDTGLDQWRYLLWSQPYSPHQRMLGPQSPEPCRSSS